ncbi:LOW QUALITY PROTEIN: anaphase-promoting complex subunit 11-like [Liolophura sinensis]|uniref:LOW QUALITY PROTEIN: anaphase-promoting complex subunit 11-like n=1 Tax=Liolophura sinensis TaxID=3198878 RepID=UPI003158F4AA
MTSGMKVTVKSRIAVAAWRWIANDENCGICRMPFDGCCPDCKLPGDDCPLVWPVFPLLPHALYSEVAELAAGAAVVPHVQARVEV